MAKLPHHVQLERFARAQATAEARGGQLHSTSYRGVDHAYDWECHEGHRWSTTYDCVINRGHWCSKCTGRTPDISERLSTARALAAARGGECLADSYRNTHSNMDWRCAAGHTWAASLSNIRRGKWCPTCAGNTADAAQRIRLAHDSAARRGGLCLSTSYQSRRAPMAWQCAAGHDWTASYSQVVQRGTWCNLCTGTARDANSQLELARSAAVARKGRCLSENYVNSRVHMAWQCSRQHTWTAPFSSVVNGGQWCPTCASGLRERLTRDIFEQLFGQPFRKVRPSWLVNPETRRKMELDGANLSLGVAFEYQGEQHYQLVSKFKTSDAQLQAQIFRDDVKRRLCAAHGVYLIEIKHTTPLEDVARLVYEDIAAQPELANIYAALQPWTTVVAKTWTESERYSLTDLSDKAAQRGGQCLSGAYLGTLFKHHWRCASGHEWQATWDTVMRGSWCPVCCGNIVDHQARMRSVHDIAQSHGGTCLTSSISRMRDPLAMRCAYGHTWTSRYDRLAAGRWCPVCARKKGPAKGRAL